jgi:EAL domain-containing protein (putative c-di-GMP-specific phosphodiesterase class I)
MHRVLLRPPARATVSRGAHETVSPIAAGRLRHEACPRPPRELSLDSLLERLTPTPGGWVATYRDTTLRSVFQPVLSITHKRVVGYEALLRVVDENGALKSPAALFDRTRAAADVLLLDRLARCLHTANFVAQRIGDGWLFLNVTPRVLDSGLVQRGFVDALCRHFDCHRTASCSKSSRSGRATKRRSPARST